MFLLLFNISELRMWIFYIHKTISNQTNRVRAADINAVFNSTHLLLQHPPQGAVALNHVLPLLSRLALHLHHLQAVQLPSLWCAEERESTDTQAEGVQAGPGQPGQVLEGGVGPVREVRGDEQMSRTVQ